MRRCLLFLLFLTIANVKLAKADEWDFTEKVLGGAALTMTVLDWRQTQVIAKHPTQWIETNSSMPEHPGMGDVNRHFIKSIAFSYVVAEVLPHDLRKLWLASCIVYEYDYVTKNHRLGIRIVN